jgi:hypothetical protein
MKNVKSIYWTCALGARKAGLVCEGSMSRPVPIPPNEALTLQLIAWAAERPRTYGEAMDAWRTGCPRLPIWEDAVDARLIEVLPAAGGRTLDRPIRVTSAGQALLDPHS